MRTKRIIFIAWAILGLALPADAQKSIPEDKLRDLDRTMENILRDWNVPGCGIGIVMKDRLVFAKGYGYRDLERRLLVTPNTLFQIASNTKLFTATAIGFLVEAGKLDWDKPVKQYVPQIRFYNDGLDADVTIRDMLSHRTGISRHDNIWFKSDFTRQQLFEKLKYLEPSIPLRQGYLYNNMMYAAAGQIVEYLSGNTWEKFVKDSIFSPLHMTHSLFTVEEMRLQADYMIPYYEKRDTTLLVPYPFYTKQQGIGPAGSIISSINDLSNWLIAQMNRGRFENRQVIPRGIITETMRPASITASVPDKYYENLNSLYGMGRGTSSYKGHFMTAHGGAIGGIYSNISFMPADSIGVIVFANGAHAGQLPGIITNIVYDRMLNLGDTPWSERSLKDYLKNKETSREIRKKPEIDRIPGTRPSHDLDDFAGVYEDAAYGIMQINYEGGALSFTFNNTTLPLSHYHYNRFVSPDDEIVGKWSLLFNTDAQGSINQVRVSLDENEVVFTRKADPRLSDPKFLKGLTGLYELNGRTVSIVLSNNTLAINTAPPQHLEPYKGYTFRVREFSDQVVEFILDSAGTVTGLKVTFDGKALMFSKKN